MLDLLIKITLVVLVILIGATSYHIGYLKGIESSKKIIREN